MLFRSKEGNMEEKKEKSNESRRILAAWLDMHIVFLLNIVVYGLVITLWRFSKNYFYAYIGSCSQYLVFAVYIVTYTASMFGYYWVLEIVLKKRSLGKFFAKYKAAVSMELYDRDKILLHICCRIIACLVYPVTILYLMFTGRMIYDKIGRAHV